MHEYLSAHSYQISSEFCILSSAVNFCVLVILMYIRMYKYLDLQQTTCLSFNGVQGLADAAAEARQHCGEWVWQLFLRRSHCSYLIVGGYKTNT